MEHWCKALTGFKSRSPPFIPVWQYLSNGFMFLSMSVEEILAEIQKLPKHEAELVQRALRERGSPSVFELAGHLFDGAEDLPPDLSTNPKYLERFGQ